MAEISVVIPVYNVEKTLERCVESVLAQTFKDLEVILVNDGSTDSSGVICDQYAKKDKRVRVIHKDNGGLSSARNAGIEIAHGEYLGFVDSDDWIDVRMYEKLYRGIITEKADISSCSFQYTLEEDILQKNVTFSENITYEVFESKAVVHALFNHPKIRDFAWNKLYRKRLFQDIRYPVGKLYEDTFTTYRLYCQAKKIVHTDYLGYYYMENPSSITKAKYSPRQYDLVTERRKVLKDVKVNYPCLVPIVKEMELRSLITLAAKIINTNAKENNDHLLKIKQEIKDDFLPFSNHPYLSLSSKVAIFTLLLNQKLFIYTHRIYLKVRKAN